MPFFCPLYPTYLFHLFSTCLILLIHQTQPSHQIATFESNFGQKQKALESLVIRFRSSYWALVRLLHSQQSFQATTLEIENLERPWNNMNPETKSYKWKRKCPFGVNALLKQLKGSRGLDDLYWWASKWLVFRSRLAILPVFQVPLGLCPAYSATQSFLSEKEQLTWADAYLRVTHGVISTCTEPSSPAMPATGRARCPCKRYRCAASVWTFYPQPPPTPSPLLPGERPPCSSSCLSHCPLHYLPSPLLSLPD